MGLDIVMYGQDDKTLGIEEIEYALHFALFYKNNNWDSYHYLRKIRGCYLIDVEFNRDEIDEFINDLKNIQIFIPENYHPLLNRLIKSLSDNKIKKIYIIGD